MPARPRSRRRRVLLGLLAAFVILGALTAVAGLRLASSARSARSDLVAARQQLSAARAQALAGHPQEAGEQLRRATAHINDARAATSRVEWRVAAHTPLLADSVRTTRAVTAAADALARDVLPSLIEVGASIDPTALRSAPGTIDPAPIAAAGPTLSAAAEATRRIRGELASAPDSGALRQVRAAREQLLASLDQLLRTVGGVQNAVAVLPAALGNTRPTRWFFALQTPSEARGTGGLLGSAAIVEIDRGRLHVERIADNDELSLPREFTVPLPSEYAVQWGSYAPALSGINAGVSPHFPYAAQIWAAQWEHLFHEHIDGAVAVDPYVFQYLLQAVGAVTLSDGTVIRPESAATFVLKDQYFRYPDKATRTARLRELMAMTLDKTLSGRASTARLVAALQRGLRERRITAAMPGDTTVQARLEHMAIGGALPPPARGRIGVVLNDAGGDKLDYWLRRDISLVRSGCDSARSAVLTVSMQNTAPASGLPVYMTLRSDVAGSATRPPVGQRRDQLSIYLPDGVRSESVTVDGRPASTFVGRERGYALQSVIYTVDPGAQATIALRLTGSIVTEAHPDIWAQTLISSPTVRISDEPCQR